MRTWQKGLILNNQQYSFKELLQYSAENVCSATTMPWEKEVYRFIIDWLSDQDHIIQYSSGTTGKIKEIRLSKQSMIASASSTCKYFRLKEKQTALHCLPIEYIAGKMMIVRCMTGNLNLYLTIPKSKLDLTGFDTIDFCAMVPLQVLNILTARNKRLPVSKLIIGGAEINPALESMLLNIPTEVYATYGMAETCSHVALRRINGPGRQEVYHALPDVKLSCDNRNCLVIDASYLPNQVVTNDLVKLTGPGSFKWIGRFDNLINSGGVKIVPEEVEASIRSKALPECAVIGLPDAELGQKLVFVFEEGKTPLTIPELITDFENILPRHWQPKEIISIKKLPRNKSFKIDRKKLIEMILK
jgi:O-succinylbenzoic acid--CoA ligase